MNYQTLWLILLLGFTVAGWLEPMTLSEENTNSQLPTIYIDSKTMITHAVWIEDSINDYKLAYRQIRHNKSLSEIKYLEKSLRPNKAQIVGAGDGLTYYVVYEAKHDKNDDNNCTETNKLSCYEIFFTSSYDGGLNWNPPIMIKHDNNNDPIHRKDPRMVYLEDNKQIIITYNRNGVMCYVFRIGDQSEFSMEKPYPFSTTASNPNIVFTIDSKYNQPIFHFLYVDNVDPKEILMYSKSNDLGKTWSNPIEIFSYNHKDDINKRLTPYAVANKNLAKDSIFIGIVMSNKGYLLWSNNSGDTWSEPLDLKSNAENASPLKLKICSIGKGKHNKLYTLYKAWDNTKFVFGSLDLGTYEFTEQNAPLLTNSIKNYDISCYIANNAIIAAIMEEEINDMGTINLRYDGETKTTTIFD